MRAVIVIVKDRYGEEPIGTVPEIDLKPISLSIGRQGYEAQGRRIGKVWSDGNGKAYTVHLKLVEIIRCPECGRRGYLRERGKTKEQICIRCGHVGS